LTTVFRHLATGGENSDVARLTLDLKIDKSKRTCVTLSTATVALPMDRLSITSGQHHGTKEKRQTYRPIAGLYELSGAVLVLHKLDEC